ncbi:hypothetical protein CDL12_25527 [Handroanthus impetiginosus]|uniref:Structure-specific endonuclease subunit SLX1 homolog n=1 Tax=Handroanthus impetiginosus TaxID=429701 RepID=A0A2G9G9R1_9LAMI|nr:hypothetical protein CDL12_25527 [Handroanthus impetiginosus]
MRKRKGRKETEETLASTHEVGENGEEEEERRAEGARFFACYLLTSLSPRFKGHTYIGYTVNPRRRIRQHNGEIGSGAWRTKRKRPWEMVLCIYGFPTNIGALQFEWAWQHPVESLAVRTAASSFKSLSGLANKIKLVYTMLSLPAWQSLNLTVNLFSTKYQKYTSCCPPLPEQMRTQVCSMDDLPCYNVNAFVDNDCDDSLQESTEDESTEAARKFHDSPSYDGSSEENANEKINHRDDASIETGRCSVKTSEERTRNSSPIRSDQGRSFIINEIIDIVEDMQTPTVVEFTREFDRPLKNQTPPTLVAKEEQVAIKNCDIFSRDEVEIIDVFTPSPCRLVNSGSKKRKQALYPEVIDLTNSPMFV